MITLYAWQTPNCLKILLLLEELQIPYDLKPVNLGIAEHTNPDFRALTPNGKVPVLIDSDLEKPLFESGAILWYLAEKYQAFIPQDLDHKSQVHAWLMWQMSALGPMFQECFHARVGSKMPHPYSVQRFTRESLRLFGVLNQHLKDKSVMVRDYGIADMAIFPWVRIHERAGLKMQPFTFIKSWYDQVESRSGSQNALRKLIAIQERG